MRSPSDHDQVPILRHHTQLRAAPDPAGGDGTCPLPSPRVILEEAGDDLDRVRRSWRDARYDRFRPRAFRAVADHLAAALAALAGRQGEPFTVDDLVAAGMLPRHVRLVNTALAMLEADGLARACPGGRWRLGVPADPGELARGLLRDHPAFSTEVLLVSRMCRELPDVLRGERDPRELLSRDGGGELLRQLYDTAPLSRFANQVARALLGRIVAALPDDRPLRVLEVGAGTGGTTAALLPLLPPHLTRYTFTDVWPLFHATARRRFACYDFVDYRRLDLDEDPAAQSFPEDAYDVVVTANALHTARDVRAALERVRRLLAPGGHLLAVETHDPRLMIGIFGALDSFWPMADHRLRPDSLLLTREQWPPLLGACGFTGVVQTGDDSGPARDDLSITLAARPLPRSRSRAAAAPPPTGTRWIVAAEDAGELPFAQAVARLLTADGHAAGQGGAVAVLSTPDPGRWRTLLASGPPTGAVGVVLVAAERTDGAGSDDEPRLRLDEAVERMLVLKAIALACDDLPAGLKRSLSVVTRPSGALPAPEEPLVPADAVLWGAARALAGEDARLRVPRISLHRTGDLAADARRLARELLSPPGEGEVALTRRGRFVVREMPYEPLDTGTGPCVLGFDDLGRAPYWTRAEPARPPGPGAVVIEARAVSWSGPDTWWTCAGRITAVGRGVREVAVGDRVVGVGGGAPGSHLSTTARLVREIPAGMGFAEAAVRPGPVMRARRALAAVGLSAGSTLVLHDATATGLAALHLALRQGARVVALARHPGQRDLLDRLGSHEVVDAADPDVVARVLARTGGRGADVLAGAVPESWRAMLAPAGRHACLDAAGPPDPRLFHEVMDAARDGLDPVPPYHVHPAARVGEVWAERRAAAVALSFDPLDGPVRARPRAVELRPDPQGAYLVIGGVGGFGAAAARRLAERGARRLALVSRRGEAAPEAAAVAAGLRALGARVSVHAADVTDLAAMAAVLKSVDAGEHPLRGVVHAAMAPTLSEVRQLTARHMADVLGCKMAGALVLHRLLEGRDLDLVWLFSSISGTYGGARQAAYAAGNVFVEALIRRRRHLGLPGHATAWGTIADTGFVARHGAVPLLSAYGFAPMPSEAALTLAERMMAADVAVAAVSSPDARRLRVGDDEAARLGPLLASQGNNRS
ncbi:SDR family NAD(P)-dependent oxidoreductase [Nonomuraea sp. NPDC049725]|uniref:SDR family NAD(P)-dependent oxidoreductase n=1 Tax=Nonomuraea sp. NPDC049725 TaxID=3154508 RepID=UPI00342DB14C